MAYKNKNGKLTPRQSDFVEAFLRLQNGTAAYREVHDFTGKMTNNTAAVGASENLRKPNIANAIAKRREQLRLLNPGCTVEELCEAWADEIRFDIGELVDPVAGGFCTPDTLPPKARKVVQGIEIKEDIVRSNEQETVIRRSIKYKLPDRQRAKIELGKRLGFYPAERLELSAEIQGVLDVLTPESRAAVIAELRQRMAASKRGAEAKNRAG